MKKLNTVLIASALLVSFANAGCCVTNCCKVTKCIQTYTKCVPYQSCKKVCVPVTDACGNVVGYKQVKQCTTKYKKVVVKKEVCCCN
jgi:hypothetical protein